MFMCVLGGYIDYTVLALKLFTNFMEDTVVVRLRGNFGGQILWRTLSS